ncbi:hypothetical protein K3495_g15702, partial [Podosphaera aphanis]
RDFTQTYAGVCRNTSWKVALAIAAIFDLEIEQLDAVTAFLNSTADRNDIYAELPPNWWEPEMIPGVDYVCRLLKALYGLKQSPRLWQKHLRRCLEELGYTPLESDNCVYIHRKDHLVVVSYVDDFLLLGKSKEVISKMKAKLAQKFQLEDLGPAHYFLGVRITRDRVKRCLWLTQDAYCRQILERFGMDNCRPSETPMAPGYEVFLVPNTGQASVTEIKEYQSKIGSLLYLAVHTRPDISYSVSVFSRYLTNPSLNHIKGVDRILRYIKGTINLGIMYDGTASDTSLYCHSDSDWGGNKASRRSTGGSVFFLAGGVISASSKGQTSVALSSTEAEYYALTASIKELLWIQQLMRQMGYLGADVLSTRVYGDNQGCLALSENPELHQRTKHIDIKHHFIRDHIDSGRVCPRYIPTNLMAADGLT